jgi:glycosyltransferase involved in cell wall biosynthesis
MKILIVSMRSIHTIRWVSQLKNSGHDVYYFDILNGGYIKEWDWVTQFTDWRYKFSNFKGRYFIKKYFPKIHSLLENNVQKEFDKILKEVKPDVVHSFVLYISCVPIFDIMQNNKHIKWIYSAWGNDLYFNQNKPIYKKEIVKVLPHLDYMFADCKRDLNLAVKLGFKGEILGDFPGGGGYHLDMIEEDIKSIDEREGIIIKGYHGEKHRGLQVLKALELIINLPKITIFSADDIVYNYYKNSEILIKNDITIYRLNQHINHKNLCRLMNSSLIYIGNNLSDGLPNTLLEAICFGTFPIQSDPGGASAEVIVDGENGLLIKDCDDILEIKLKIEKALSDKKMLIESFKYNMNLRNNFEYNFIRKQVINKYNEIEIKLYKIKQL